MDFIDQLHQFSKRVSALKQQINTEEATKTAIIMPFFQMLGYDVFNPEEFIPEFTADVGIKKGEKVDYAIKVDNEIVILVEAKSINEELDKHDSQLFRYFATSKAKFAILTNGITYKFYTDLEEQNKMDEQPFLEINILDIKDNYISELKKFQKSSFDIENILNTAEELKYSGEIKKVLSQQLQNPTDEFISYILNQVYTGRKTQNVIDKFRNVVKKALNQYINELLNEKFKLVIETEKEVASTTEEIIETEENSKIITTEEELEGYYIIKSLLRNTVESDKITYKDTESYYGILYENNTRKWICRLQVDKSQKYIIIPDENKNSIKHPIDSIDDIYNFQEELIAVVKRYL